MRKQLIKKIRQCLSLAKFIYITILTVIIFPCCQTIPPGEPPPDGIIAPPVCEPINQLDQLNQKQAVAKMLASIVAGCPQIFSAASTRPPALFNDFTFSSDGRVNNMPMELWSQLIKTKLISPRSDKTQADYILYSEFLPADEIENKKFFLWKMHLNKTDDSIETTVWQDEIRFFISSED